MSQTATLIALCQVNVALGILYIGLREARYRQKAYESIVEILNAHKYCRVTDSTHFTEMLLSEGVFARKHHLIVDWIRELPGQIQAKLDEHEK